MLFSLLKGFDKKFYFWFAGDPCILWGYLNIFSSIVKVDQRILFYFCLINYFHDVLSSVVI